MITPSKRSAVPPFTVMTVLQRVAELRATGREVISLCAGEPSQGAPSDVKRRLGELMIDRTPLGYSETFGIRPLREAIAGHYRRWYDLDIPVEQIAITTGSSGAFVLSFLAAFDPGDRVLLARPGYPAYRNILTSLGCQVVELGCGPAERFQPTHALLDQALADGPVAGLMLASPANPTGTMVDHEQLAELVAWCAEHHVRLISDEIYHGISYGRGCASARQFGTDAVVVGSLSKYHSMTGWRVGWLVVPPELVRPIELLVGNLNICAPAVSQVAALGALSDEARVELEGHVRRYAVNRDLLLGRAPEIGVTTMAPPDGAFYLYADVSHLTGDSMAWCFRVLADTGVALTPGVDFDTRIGRQFVRLSFAGGTAEVDEALTRLAAYV